jgi:molybdopterin synthase sulfur carrier subunit
MSVTVRIPSPLRRLTNGQEKIELDSSNIEECIATMEKRFPGMQERLLDESGQPRYFVNIYVNGEDTRFLQGLATPIKSGDEVSIVPAVAGGCDSTNLSLNALPVR